MKNINKSLIESICKKYSENELELCEIRKRRILKQQKQTDLFCQDFLEKENKAYEAVMNNWFEDLYKTYTSEHPNTGIRALTFSYDNFQSLGFIKDKYIESDELIKYLETVYNF